MFQFEMHETKNLEVKRLDEVRLIIFQQYACDIFQRFYCVVVYKKGWVNVEFLKIQKNFWVCSIHHPHPNTQRQ